MALLCEGSVAGASKRSPSKLSPKKSTCCKLPAAGSANECTYCKQISRCNKIWPLPQTSRRTRSRSYDSDTKVFSSIRWLRNYSKFRLEKKSLTLIVNVKYQLFNVVHCSHSPMQNFPQNQRKFVIMMLSLISLASFRVKLPTHKCE